jgi:FkbM family methyltransferase
VFPQRRLLGIVSLAKCAGPRHQRFAWVTVTQTPLAVPHRQPFLEKLATSLQKRRLWLRSLIGGRGHTHNCRYFGARFIVDLDDVIGYEIAIRRFEWRELKLMIDACRRLKPAIFIDVGANVGLYACVLGRQGVVPKVLAIEPDRENFARLRANIELNGLAGVVEARHAAAADRAGTLTLAPSGRANRGMSRIEAGAAGGYEVRAIALDEVFPLRDGVIALKIDVEGFEAQVLAGAEQLLSCNRGFAQIEAREDAAATLVADRMAALGWRFLERYGLDLRFEKP